MYPKKTIKQTKEEAEAKKFAAQQQRDQLKALVSQKFLAKYINKDSLVLQGKVENIPKEQQGPYIERPKELDQPIGQNDQNGKVNLDYERPDVVPQTASSKMSGATDLEFVGKSDNTELHKESVLFDLTLGAKRPNYKAYRNEEEEWADIYKHNVEVYKAQTQLEKERKVFDKLKFRHELDEQVTIKQQKRQRDEEVKTIDYAQVMKKVDKENLKEKKRIELAKTKVVYEKEMRDNQMREIRAQRKQELREHKSLDRLIVSKIREEQAEDARAAKKRKEDDYSYYKKLLQENEEKREIRIKEKEKEKQKEIKQIEEHNRMIEERDKARAEEARAKDSKLRNALDMGRRLLGKPNDDREKRQDIKVKRWADKKVFEDKEEELKEKQNILKKHLDIKAFLDQQIEEKKKRKLEEKRDRGEQAGIWQNSAVKYEEWEKQKAEYRREHMKSYGDLLKIQMNEKFEERRITDKLFNLRATMLENKRASIC